MTWIYDHRTEYSRLMVGYDRYGITIRQWNDDTPEGETGFSVQSAFFSWRDYYKRQPSYSRDNGCGRMKERIVAGAISLLSCWGANSSNQGTVLDLDHYIDTYHVFNC
jgi:hypothetical protein